LAAMRAQQQGSRANPYARQDDTSYEMSEVKDSTTNLTVGGDPGDSMAAFYAEISSIQDSLKTYNANVSRVDELHSRSLNNTDDAAAQRVAAQLADLVAETSALSTTLKRRIQALERQPAVDGTVKFGSNRRLSSSLNLWMRSKAINRWNNSTVKSTGNG